MRAEDRGDRLVSEPSSAIAPATELSAQLRAGEITAVELADSCLARLEAVNDQLGAFLTVTPRGGAANAQPSSTPTSPPARRSRAWPASPLALKDVLTTKGIRTTCGSKILENYMPPYDCTAVDAAVGRRQRAAGQDQLRRVRDGLVERELGVRPDAQPVGPGPRAGRIERRHRRRGRRRAAALGARHRHRRLDPPAGVALRRRGAEAHLRARVAATAWSRSPRRWTRSGRSRGACATPRSLLGVIAGQDRRDATTPRRAVPDYLDGARPAAWTACASACSRDTSARASSRASRAAVARRSSALASARREVGESTLPHAGYALAAYYLIAPAEASLEPRPLRRRPLRAARRRRRRRRDDVRAHARRGLRRRGEAPHHARHLRAVAPATTTRTTARRRRSAR